jgi:tetratricopeptide (TPR) repeat protein
MSIKHVSHFRALTATLSSLKLTATQMPVKTGALADELSHEYTEGENTHHALLSFIGTLVREAATGNEQISQDRQKSLAELGRYQQVIEGSARSIATELEGPQTGLDTLSVIMFQNLNELYDHLGESDMSDIGSDQALEEYLIFSLERWNQVDGRLISILTNLTEAQRTTAGAIQTDYQRNREKDIQTAISLNQQAVAAYHQGYRQKALALLEQAVYLAPEEVAIALNMAQLALETDRIDQAEDAWQIAAGLAAQSGEVMFTEGSIALKRGDSARAIEIFETCASATTSPADEVAYRLSLAEAYYTSGHPLPAVAQWKKILEIEPLQPIASAWLQAID